MVSIKEILYNHYIYQKLYYMYLTIIIIMLFLQVLHYLILFPAAPCLTSFCAWWNCNLQGDSCGSREARYSLRFVSTLVTSLVIIGYCFIIMPGYRSRRGKIIDAGEWWILYYHILLGEWWGIVTHRKGGWWG